MSSGEGDKAQSNSAATEGTECVPEPAGPEQERTLPGEVECARPTANDASNPGTTEIPEPGAAAHTNAPRQSAFDIDDEDTQMQPRSEAAESQLRSKGPCRAPGYTILQPLGAGT